MCILEKSQFAIEKVENILCSEVTMQLQLNNDIYSRYLCILPSEMNFVKNTLIYPASDKHLNKYSEHRTYLITETPKTFKEITLPFIEEQAGHLQVIKNG